MRNVPDETITREVARRRWQEYHEEIWRLNAEVRNDHSVTWALRILPPGSWRFRLAVVVASPLLRRRRHARAQASAPEVEFPYGIGKLVSEHHVHPSTKVGGSEILLRVVIWDGAETTRFTAHGVNIEVQPLATPSSPQEVAARLNEMIGGDASWIMVMRSDDVFDVDAVASMINNAQRAGADLATGDWCEIAEDGTRIPHFVTPTLGTLQLYSADTTGRAVAFRASSLRARGGFREYSSDGVLRDVVLRSVEEGAVVHHTARFVVQSPTARGVDRDAEIDPVRDAISRAVPNATVDVRSGPCDSLDWNVTPIDPWPSVAILIPTRDRLDLLSRCIESVRAVTSYPKYRIVVIDNDSVEPATLEYFATNDVDVVPAPGPFNYSDVVNTGVAAVTEDIIVTLNNDTVVVTPQWLESMVSLLQLPRVGLVGCYLEDPSGRPQHEGISIAPYPQHLRRDLNYRRPDAFLNSVREISAVTGACHVIRRSLWNELGGLDNRLRVVQNDVDFCLRVQRHGYKVIYTPRVKILHAESSSRGSLTPEDDIVTFVARWDIFGEFRDGHFPERLELIGDIIRCRRDEEFDEIQR